MCTVEVDAISYSVDVWIMDNMIELVAKVVHSVSMKWQDGRNKEKGEKERNRVPVISSYTVCVFLFVQILKANTMSSDET